MAKEDFRSANRKVNGRLVSLIRTYWAAKANEFHRPAVVVDSKTTFIKSDMINGQPKRR